MGSLVRGLIPHRWGTGVYFYTGLVGNIAAWIGRPSASECKPGSEHGISGGLGIHITRYFYFKAFAGMTSLTNKNYATEVISLAKVWDLLALS